MKKCDLCDREFKNSYLECDGIKICDKCGEIIEEEFKEQCDPESCSNH